MSSSTATLQGFLSHSRPSIKASQIDFTKENLSEYHDAYAVILDDVLSKEECQQLIAIAEASSELKWEPAKVNRGNYKQELQLERRRCDRMILENRELAARIWNRIKEYVPEVQLLDKQPNVTGPGPTKRGEIWKMARLNENLRFLRYGPEEYFNRHMDGTFETPDKSERSMYTIHLYLNEADAENNLVGGATTFHGTCDCPKWESCECEVVEYDVHPKYGRVLLFQQRGLKHSGAKVLDGVKLTMRTDILYTKESSN